MKKKTKTTESSTANSVNTNTPTVAPWLNQNYEQQGGLISDFASKDPTSFVAAPSALQTQAFGKAANLGGWKGLLGDAADEASSVAGAGSNTATGASMLDGGGVTPYMNSGLEDIIKSSLDNFDYSAGRAGAAMKAKSALNKAFNNTRSVFGETQFAADTVRQRSDAEAKLRYDAFDKAAALAAQDAQLRQQSGQFNAGQEDSALARQLQAAGLLGDLGNSTGTNERADLAGLLSAGDTQRSLEQEKLNAEPTFLQLLARLNRSIPIGSFTSTTGTGNTNSSGTSTSTTSDPMGALSGLLSAAGAAASGAGSAGLSFSDERLKDDIKPIGQDTEGRDVYSYRYKWDDAKGKKRVGYMAQDLLKTDPEAVRRHPSGALMVDYGLLGAM